MSQAQPTTKAADRDAREAYRARYRAENPTPDEAPPQACPVCGRSSCEDPAHLPPEEGGHEREPAKEPAKSERPRFKTASAVMLEAPPVFIIDGFAWRYCITVLVSESGAGKTFVLLAMAAAVADGDAWHGRRVRRGSVAYVSFEGDALGLRLRALSEAGYSLEDVHVLRGREPLSPRVERDGAEVPSAGEIALAEDLADLASRLAAAGRPPLVLIVVDTVRASLAGSEDRSEDVAAYLRAVRRLMEPYREAAAILAHHAGWQDGEQRRKRERGSSAFRGNADGTAYLEASDEKADEGCAYLTLRSLKVRDDEKPAPLRLVRRRVAVAALDDEGQPRRTCIIERDSRALADLEAAAAKAKAEEAAEFDRRALEAIGSHEIRSIAALRAVLGCKQDLAAEVLARLLADGRIRRRSQREPYRVVPSRTRERKGTTRESYRTHPPTGGTGTTQAQGPKRPSSRTAPGDPS